MTPCSLVEVYSRIRGEYFHHHSEDGGSTHVYFCESTQRYIPESCHLQTRRHENLKYHKPRINNTIILYKYNPASEMLKVMITKRHHLPSSDTRYTLEQCLCCCLCMSRPLTGSEHKSNLRSAAAQ
jgi:hypothetical protein